MTRIYFDNLNNRKRYILLIFGLILIWSYAEVPFFNTIKDIFELSRNNYDKIGHFVQGFVPAMIAREIFIRKKIINSKTLSKIHNKQLNKI